MANSILQLFAVLLQEESGQIPGRRYRMENLIRHVLRRNMCTQVKPWVGSLHPQFGSFCLASSSHHLLATMAELDGIPKPTGCSLLKAIEVDDALLKSKYTARLVAPVLYLIDPDLYSLPFSDFPETSKFVSAERHGASFWTSTARIDLELADGTPYRLFLKTATGDLGMRILRGEYHGAKAIHRFTPEGIPRPVAWGTYSSDPSTHFYLCEFMDMKNELPDIRKFSSMLAKLHRDSMASQDSPGRFGFHVVTHEGSMYQDLTWCTTWEEFFLRRLQSFVDQEAVAQGPSEELDEVLPRFMDKVIPRLLRPLITHGRSLRPALLHGDIWYGNLATNAKTGEPIYFDPAVFWGHNECEKLHPTPPL